MNVSETPNWLQENEGDVAASGTATIDGLEDSESGNNNDNNGSSSKKESSSRFSCSCGLITVSSLILLALFAYSAATQSNDLDGIQWIIYYSCCAAIPAVFLVYYMCCFPPIALYILTAAVAIWSIVYIVITSLKLKDTPKGGDTTGTGDNANQTLRQEYVLELAGASIGLVSSLFHACMAKCCVNKNNKDE